jgi:hypothetical protein
MLASVFKVLLSGRWLRLQHPEEWALSGLMPTQHCLIAFKIRSGRCRQC